MKTVLFLFLLISLNSIAQDAFKPGSFTKGQLVTSSGLIWRAKVNIAKATALPRAGASWEQVTIKPVLTLDYLNDRIDSMRSRFMLFDSVIWKEGDKVIIGNRFQKAKQ